MARALTSTAAVEGRGLFTNRPATIRFEPPPAGTAALHLAAFDRDPVALTDATLDPEPIHAVFANVPARSTNLRLPDATRLATLEHALSALVGLGITGATIRLLPNATDADAPSPGLIETPIIDGSARAFVDAIQHARPRPANAPAPITPTETITVTTGDDPDAPSIRIEPPAPGQARAIYRYRLRYPNEADLHESLHAAEVSWSGDADAYRADIAPARTYALEHEARALQAAGLGAHLGPRDALVIARAGPIDNALRFPDEPARHKLLDLIGDLALAGRPVLATITADRAGHALNHKAATTLRALIRGAPPRDA